MKVFLFSSSATIHYSALLCAYEAMRILNTDLHPRVHNKRLLILKKKVIEKSLKSSFFPFKVMKTNIFLHNSLIVTNKT